jgi:hypothetical protein
MDIEKKYKWILDNEEWHFFHHQLLQNDVIQLSKDLEKIKQQFAQYQKESINRNNIFIETLNNSNQYKNSMINKIEYLSKEKKNLLQVHTLQAEFMYQIPKTWNKVILTSNVYPILVALLKEQWKEYKIGVTLAYLSCENIKESCLLIQDKELQATLIKKDSWSCRVTFLHIEMETCMHESNEKQSNESYLPISNEPTPGK